MAVLGAAKEDLLPPKPSRYVTDRAGVLSPDRAEALNARLEQFEKDTSNQLLIWIDRKIPDDFALEDFTVAAARKWGAGQAGRNNGVVLFVFTQDRKMRIEVGYGLEGAIPDATAHRI
ncbi:MAG TPA: TPM domain-containing protein, partial [Thermoanaerobaculia bacterium]|nr:TPM domain-containing protein [Thermoanaerobaculia bacterium]